MAFTRIGTRQWHVADLRYRDVAKTTNSKCACGGRHEINDASSDERSTVIDADNDAASAMGNADASSER